VTEERRYKDTVNLPQTGFEMRANAVVREPELQQFWAEEKIYETQASENPGQPFILHDGPPYANGSLHIGHALNKILKDIINRYQILQGRQVRYVPGWDCHGLPIELKVLQSLSSDDLQGLTPLSLRQKATDFALKTVDEQRESFKRYGVWGDWDHPYLTLNPAYEAAQIGVFGEMVLKGHIYRGRKPVHWSPSSGTALAEAELEYPEGHVSPSIYTAFQLTELSEKAQNILGDYFPDLWVAVWTTTPWTIPANLAVSVNPELTYAVVETELEFDTAAGKFLLVAADAIARLEATFKTKLTVLDTLKGERLEFCKYKHPLFDRESPVVIGGDYVTTDSGTGLVHTAPGHGQEDYIVGQRYGLPIFSPVDAKGCFTDEVGEFAGLNVLQDANDTIIAALDTAQSLILREPYEHKYPYDWRTKKPTIFRATDQWFASIAGFREAALTAISNVEWIPAKGENRIAAMVSDRSDWCISRQRSWGVPIPVFYDQDSGEPLMTAETIAHVQAIIAERGSGAWWELSVAELLPEHLRDQADRYIKGEDTMDVWFDSGSSWAAVARDQGLAYPVDLYLEGSDQHRGWFQSSLLTSVASEGQAPYKTVLTHGFVLDEQGRKMSKSLGNVVDPAVVIEGGSNQKQDPPYGADVLRLWVSSVDYSSDVPLGKNILKQMSDVYRKIRNTARFLLGNIHDFDPATEAIAYADLPELDRYILHRTTEVMDEVQDAFETYQFFRFFQTIQNYCVVDLSNFYLDIAKDRLYISAPDAFRRRSCQTVIAAVLENLARAIAPVLCHMAEDIWQNLPYQPASKSVFQAGWVNLPDEWRNPDLGAAWATKRTYRTAVNKVMERARTDKLIGSSLDAKVLLFVADEATRSDLAAMNQPWEQVTALVTEPEIELQIELDAESVTELGAESATELTTELATELATEPEAESIADETIKPIEPVTSSPEETTELETLSNEPTSATSVAPEVSELEANEPEPVASVVSSELEPEFEPEFSATEPIFAAAPLQTAPIMLTQKLEPELPPLPNLDQLNPQAIADLISDAPQLIMWAWSRSRKIATNLGLVLALLFVLHLLDDFVNAVNSLFLLPAIFSALGVGYTGWFLYKNWLFAKDRQRTIEQFNDYKAKILGNTRPILTAASVAPDALPALTVSSVEVVDFNVLATLEHEPEIESEIEPESGLELLPEPDLALENLEDEAVSTSETVTGSGSESGSGFDAASSVPAGDAIENATESPIEGDIEAPAEVQPEAAAATTELPSETPETPETSETVTVSGSWTPSGNSVDELRYLFICSQVELVTSPEAIASATYGELTDDFGVAIVNADGHKCERCWNYSEQVGANATHPTLCERCVSALDGDF